MTHTVRIARWAAPVAVETGQTVLEAALQAGVPYPHGCRSGNCGACKSRLLRGEVEMAPWSEFALTGAERAAGLVLACRTVPWGDAEIAWLGEDDVAAHPVRKVAGRVEAVEAMTHDISAVRVSIADGGPFAFSAGQYCRLRFAGLPARDFSMANMPGEEKLEFHVRRVAGGAVSAYVADRLAVGEAVGLEGPFGAAFLRESHCGPIYAVAGGSGLAPAKSIVERALAGGAARGVSLYFGVRDERDLYLEDRFESLARAREFPLRPRPLRARRADAAADGPRARSPRRRRGRVRRVQGLRRRPAADGRGRMRAAGRPRHEARGRPCRRLLY